MKINRAVIALRIGACNGMRGPLRERSLHRPPERIDRAYRKHRSRAIPSSIAQSLSAIFRSVRLERPRSICSQLGRNAQLAQHLLRFDVARNHERIVAVALAHLL